MSQGRSTAPGRRLHALSARASNRKQALYWRCCSFVCLFVFYAPFLASVWVGAFYTGLVGQFNSGPVVRPVSEAVVRTVKVLLLPYTCFIFRTWTYRYNTNVAQAPLEQLPHQHVNTNMFSLAASMNCREQRVRFRECLQRLWHKKTPETKKFQILCEVVHGD